MPKPEKIDWFAERDEESYRDEARNILDSYAHPWDVLVELAQNAVDAIIEKRRNLKDFSKGQIFIELNATDRSILFKDNGVGIEESVLKKALKPHFSGKKGKGLRGEKGVGLTYIALVGNDFEIVTKTSSASLKLSLTGVQSWLQGSGKRPEIEIQKLESDPDPNLESFTQVKVISIPEASVDGEELDLFTLNLEQLGHLLRTRTAIGYTGTLFDIPPDPPITVKVTIKTKDGQVQSDEVPYSYASPATYRPKNALISLEEVREALSNVEEKRIYGKSIQFSKTYNTRGGKEVRAYCFLAPRQVYNEISDEKLHLPEDIRVQGGIFIATKRMPTGIILPPPKTGRAGYWPNFYLLLEYDNITLDLGRKSITAPRTIEMLKKQAAQVFNEVDRYIKYTIREDEGTLEAVISQQELQEELTELSKEEHKRYLANKDKTALPFCREPRQEQDVIAIFSMLLARGILPYEILRMSSTYRYDCFLQLSPEKAKKPVPIVAEFKFLGDGIIKDLEDAKARYGQLNLLICWKIDEKKLRQAGFIVERIENKKKELPGATHKLSFPSSASIKDVPIAVICLSDILKSQ